jgi:hypothetical protein
MTTGMVRNIRACAVTLTAVAIVTVAAAPASALRISEKTIASECREAGGTYQTMTFQSTRYSACLYHDIYGDAYADYYVNGEYDHSRP